MVCLPSFLIFHSNDVADAISLLLAIQTYYLEYLSGYYKTKVQQLVEQASQTQRFDDRMRAHFDNLVETLSLLSPSQPNVDLEVGLAPPLLATAPPVSSPFIPFSFFFFFLVFFRRR